MVAGERAAAFTVGAGARLYARSANYLHHGYTCNNNAQASIWLVADNGNAHSVCLRVCAGGRLGGVHPVCAFIRDGRAKAGALVTTFFAVHIEGLESTTAKLFVI